MDAKTAVKWLRPGRHKMEHYQDDANNVADFIEQQAKYAELGRLAIEVSNTNPAITSFCKPEYQKKYHGADAFCHTVKCPWRNFCQKRAELLAEGQK